MIWYGIVEIGTMWVWGDGEGFFWVVHAEGYRLGFGRDEE